MMHLMIVITEILIYDKIEQILNCYNKINMASKKQTLVLNEMLNSAKKRCLIPNANNGRAYMGTIVLDGYRPLCNWLQ